MRPTTAIAPSYRPSAKLTALLWTLQILLALLFAFAGVMKFIMPVEVMTKDLPLSGAFLHFIGAAEIAGALGLVLPGLLRLNPNLTPLAAGGLVIIMIGATTLTAATGQVAGAAFPAVVGVLLAFVAHRRRQIVLRRADASRATSATVEPARAAA